MYQLSCQELLLSHLTGRGNATLALRLATHATAWFDGIDNRTKTDIYHVCFSNTWIPQYTGILIGPLTYGRLHDKKARLFFLFRSVFLGIGFLFEQLN